MDSENYPEAPLPSELAEMPEGEATERVVTVKRKGDKLCFVSLEGIPLSGAAEVQSTEDEGPRYGQKGVKPSDYMMSKMSQTMG